MTEGMAAKNMAFGLLSQHTNLTTLLHSGVDSIYPELAVQDASLPYLVYNNVPRAEFTDEIQGIYTAIVHVYLDFTAYVTGRDDDAADAISEQVYIALATQRMDIETYELTCYRVMPFGPHVYFRDSVEYRVAGGRYGFIVKRTDL
jgi:hypothetical protein